MTPDENTAALQEIYAWLSVDTGCEAVPASVCPIVARVVVATYSIPGTREALVRLLPSIIGTRSTPDVENARALIALDWLARIYTPAWLDLVPAFGLYASALRGCTVSLDDTDAVEARALAAMEAAIATVSLKALAPVIATLQASMIDALQRMLAVRGEQ